ncbi:unnamed protein product [Prunus brigantina]
MLFLLYWLNRFILPNQPAHCHPGESAEPFCSWRILDDPDLAAEVPTRSIEEYLMFFRHCTKRSTAQWQKVPEEEAARTDFKKKFLSVTLPRDLPHGGGKPPNYHLGVEVYHPNFCVRHLGCPQLIPLKSYRSCNRASSWRDADDLEVHKDTRCAINKISNSADALYPSWGPNSCSSADFEAWWKARFQDLPTSVTFLISFPAGLASNFGLFCAVTSVIATGDLELPSVDEEDETQAEQTPVEATPPARKKRKGTAPPPDNIGQPDISAESPPPPPSKSKRRRKRTEVEYVATKEPAAVPTTTSGTDEELREAFEAVEQEKELEKLEELALFEDAEAEHSTAVPAAEEQVEQSASEPVEQAELPVAAPESVMEVAAAAPELMVEVPRSAGVLSVVTSPLKPPIVAMPIHSLPGSSATASLADPELAEFKAMDLDAQLDRLEMLSSPIGKAKSKAVEEAMERLKIWQSTELELDEDREAIDQLMKDLDLLHRQNMAPKPILEMSLGLARDVLNLHDRYEDLKPTFKTSEFCKATHEANLADFAKQRAELDQMVAGYKEAKATTDKLEKHIAELPKQLAECREVQNRLGAGLGSKTKATFLVQSMVVASRPALEIADASIHQGVLLQKELSIKKTNLQETLKKLGF